MKPTDPTTPKTDAVSETSEKAAPAAQAASAEQEAFIISDFKDTNFGDTGNERRFTAGTVETLPKGIFDNYEHVNLVRAATADDKRAAA